ncbi:MAG: selenide, water dikinase SelD [Gammaproteobacteria bacterium]|nr:selenide, water dikinase SelD [Gammaproteobacteria bacterium]
MQINPVHKDIVLVGGGHSHALVIRNLAMNPIPGTRITLISRDALTPYSGMLPGLVAGHYTHEEIHIDLRSVCQWAGVRFIESEMTALDLAEQLVELQGRPAVPYDVLSLDTGSTPLLNIPGSERYTTPVKPVYTFYERWERLRSRVNTAPEPMHLGVVGAGAGGFELVMAMQHALSSTQCQCHWFLRGATAINERPDSVGIRALAAADRAGVQVHRNFDVQTVSEGLLTSTDGQQFELQEIIWCTAAGAPHWPSTSGLSTDDKGFVLTHNTLQSVSHPTVFASGDIGTVEHSPNAKAGVYAVRQAPILAYNLRALLSNKPLRQFRAQKTFLSLMATGGKNAIASRGMMTIEGAWVWRWKHAIDSKFMNLFRHLKPISMSGSVSNQDREMPCSGCGSKVARNDLASVLASLKVVENDSVQMGIGAADDVALLQSSTGTMVQSVDHLRAIVDDPYLFGRITALHALSDLFTATDVPTSAQVLVTIPYGSAKIVRRELTALLTGCVEECNKAGVSLVGGHTTEGSELTLGLVVNGEASDSPHAKPVEGDVLVLTQPLGIGILFRGQMEGVAKGYWISAAIESMLKSNEMAGRIFRSLDVGTMTDITGFGLLNHADNMLEGSDSLRFAINPGAIPLLPGVLELSEAGIQSTLLEKNIQSLPAIDGMSKVNHAMQNILSDPQTGGGLLAIVPKALQHSVLDQLVAANYEAAVIGAVAKASEHRLVAE